MAPIDKARNATTPPEGMPDHGVPDFRMVRPHRPVSGWRPYPWPSALGTATGIALLAWRRALGLGLVGRVS